MKNLRYIVLLIVCSLFISTSFAQMRFPGKTKNADEEIRWLNTQLLISTSYDKKVEIYLGLGQVYDESGKYQSIYYFNNAVSCADSSNVYELRYRARYKVAIEFVKKERFKEAYDKINEAIKLSNDNRNTGDIEKAIKFSETISDKIINKVEQNIQTANGLVNSNYYQEAISTLNQSAQLLNFILFSQNDNDIKKANELSEKIQNLVINKIENNIQVADKLIGSKEIQGAISKLEPSVLLADFIRRYNYQYSTRVKLSDAYSLNNQYKKAIQTLNAAFDISLKNNKISEAKKVVNLIEKNYNALGENQDVISKIRNDLLDSLKRKIENLKLTKQVDSNLLAEYNDVKRSFSDSSGQIIKKQFNSDLKGRYIELIEQKRRLQRLVYILLISIIFILLAALIAFRAYSIKKKQEIELNKSKKSIEMQALTLDEQNEELISTLDGLANAQNELKERNKEIEKQNELLKIVSEITKDLSRQTSKNRIFAEMSIRIKEQLKCMDCFIFLPTKEKDFYLRYEPIGNKFIKDNCFKTGEGTVGKVFMEGKTVLEDDVYQNKYFEDDIREDRSMLLVPIKIGDHPIAVICTGHDQKEYFTKNDQYFVELLASQASNAIERANGLEIIYEIGNQILNLEKKENIKNLLRHILEGAIELTNSTTGVIYLISEDSGSIKESYYPDKGFIHPSPRLDNPLSITRQIIFTHNIIFIKDIKSNSHTNPTLHDKFKSSIGIPLIFEEIVIGVLYLNDEIEHDYSEAEISLLQTLAGQAAIAITNAKIYEEINSYKNELELKVEERTKEIDQSKEILQTINEISKSIVSELNISKINYIVYEKIKEHIEINMFGIGLYNEKSNELYFNDTIEDGKSENWLTKLNDENSYAAWCYNNQNMVIIDDEEIEYSNYIKQIQAPIIGSETKSIIYIPLSMHFKKLGVFTVQAKLKNAFNETDKMFLMYLANYIAIAIDNAWVYEEISKKNISLEKMLEEEKRLKEQSQLMLSLIEHEFKTPLVIIQKTTNLLKRELSGSENKYNSYLDRIIRNVNLSYQLFDKFKTINSLYTRKKFEPIELNPYQITLEIKERFIRENEVLHQIEIECTERNRKVLIDPVLFELILNNLLSNASKYSPKEGLIKIDIEFESKCFVLQVHDHGIGIPEDLKDRIFDLFIRGENTGNIPGTGAGLAIVKKSVELSHAKIEIKTIINKGTSFIIHFPLNYYKTRYE